MFQLMIWYLLYPFRGTTEPPHLAHNHPIRRFFYRLGTLIARHWLASIVFSVGVGVTLCYPSVFLHTNPTAGFASQETHVWASARLFDDALARQPDVEVRQVWIYGSYMKALQRDVLQEALRIQNSIIQEGFDTPRISSSEAADGANLQETPEPGGFSTCGLAATKSGTWAFHSPLMYWNCSKALIEDDRDALTTINNQSQRQSYMNLTLRPASVLAGKTFVNGNITAADVLVVTFFDLANPTAGAEWDRRIRELAENPASLDQWYLPDKGHSSHTYEFYIKPMSLNDALILVVCYSVMVAYVLANLRRTRAVKSTLGLGLTIVTELTVSIVASLTICSLLSIDIGLIPREVYPFVVFTIGLENMFRITNAVVSTPAATPTVQRIATAMGEVGHLSLAVAAQNLVLLWILSRLVAPSVQAFCAFAAIALIVDFVMHISFFVAVLTVDVQRLELQDSLDRISTTPRRTKSPHRPERQTWGDALRHGRLPFSTRVAGTAVMISLIIALNWHVFDNMSLLQMLQTMRPGKEKAGILFSSATLPPVNSRRSPGHWLRMQDRQTAKEVIRLVKPRTQTFIARIHQPVVVVLNNANRGVAVPRTETVLALVRDVIDAHLIPFALTVVVLVALTTILMNYLLWNELSEQDGFDGGDDEDESLHVGRLWRSHEHDIIKVVTTCRHILAVSSDRLLTANTWDMKRNTYLTRTISADSASPPLWPINAVAINETGTWLAAYAKDGRVGLSPVGARYFKHVVQTPLQDQSAILSTFLPPHTTEEDQCQYLLLTSDGHITSFIISGDVSTSSSRVLSSTPLYATFITCGKGQPKIYVLSHNGTLSLLSKHNGIWSASPVNIDKEPGSDAVRPARRALTSAAQLDLLILAQGKRLQLLSDVDGESVATLELSRPVRRGTLRVLHSPRRECPQCRGAAAHALMFSFTDANTSACVMLTYKFDGDTSLLCFSPAEARARAGCKSIRDAIVTTQMVDNPGVWAAAGLLSVIGLRKKHEDGAESETEEETALSTSSDIPRTPIAGDNLVRPRHLSRSAVRSRSRRDRSTGPFSIGNSGLEDWEIWTLSSGDQLETCSLTATSIHCNQAPVMRHREHEQLYAATAGPVQRLGKRSVAVALANTIFDVTLGGFQDPGNDSYTEVSDGSVAWRTRGRERLAASR